MKNPFSRKKGGETVKYRLVMPSGSQESHQKFLKLEEKVTNAPFNPTEHLDKKRAYIAQLFVWGFLTLILLVLVGVPLYNKWVGHAQPLDLDKTLSQVSGLLGTPLGFVVGYYFKENKKK